MTLLCLIVSHQSSGQSCIVSHNLTVTPLPSAGTYPPGTTVQFCYNVTLYNNTAVNWHHGVVPILGPGWDASTLQPVGQPASLDLQGVWLWTSGFTSTFTGTFFGNPGWFYDSAAGGPLDGNPGNNYGDNSTGPWTFCWEVTTLNGSACVPGLSLDVVVENYGDSESGSWTSAGCASDPELTSTASLVCCNANVTTANPDCGANNGAVSATGINNGPWDYQIETAGGTVLFTANNSWGPAVLSNLGPGDYVLMVTDNTGCTFVENVTLATPSAVNAQASASPVVLCPGDVSQLDAAALVSGGNCGLNSAGCTTTPSNYDVGTTATSTGAPTPFEGYWEDSRVQ